MSARASFKEGLSFGMLSFASMAVLGIGSGIAIARAYGIDVVGAYALAYAPVALCGTFSTVQEQAALMRELAVLPARAPRITALLAVVVAFSTALTTLVAVVAGVVAALLLTGPVGQPDLVWPALVLLAEYALLGNLGWNVDVVFAAFRAGRQLFWIRLLTAVGFLVVAVALSFPYGTVWALVVAHVASTVAALALRAVLLPRFMRWRVPWGEVRDGARLLPEMLRFGVKVMPAHIADGASNEAGTWIVGVTSPVATVGGWTRAWQLSQRLLEPTYRVAEMLFPTLVERRKGGDTDGFARALLGSSRLVGTGLLLVAACAGGASDAVMSVYGPGFGVAADALTLTLLVPVFYCTATLLGQAMLALDRPLLWTGTTVARTVAVFALGVPLAAAWGITGMAAATALAYASGLLLIGALTRRHVPGAHRLVWPARSIAAALGGYAAGFACARALDVAVDGLLALVVALPAGACAFALVFVALGGLTTDDRRHLRALHARARGLRRRVSPVPTA